MVLSRTREDDFLLPHPIGGASGSSQPNKDRLAETNILKQNCPGTLDAHSKAAFLCIAG